LRVGRPNEALHQTAAAILVPIDMIAFIAAAARGLGVSVVLAETTKVGVDINDLADRRRSIHASAWQWRPTVEVIRSLGLFDSERLDRLSKGIGEFNGEETRQLAQKLENEVLAHLRPGQRILYSGKITDEPDGGTFYRRPEELESNYSVDQEWLARFVGFCKSCQEGIYVS
jgi:hypothetical protein